MQCADDLVVVVRGHGPVREHERFAGQLRDVDPCAGREAVGRGDDDSEQFAFERSEREVVIGGARADERNVSAVSISVRSMVTSG
jgi:hypothetical protein